MKINHCYCINLYESTNRKQSVSKIFEKYNLSVNFYQTQRDPVSGERGCFSSHVAIINLAYENNFENVLIFEDDIICNLTKKEFNKEMKKIYNFINNRDYDIFFLGSGPNIMNRKITHVQDNIYKTHAVLAHAYILSRSAIEKYRTLVYTGIPIDYIYQSSDKSYAIYPSIFYQDDSGSTIAPSWIQWFGQKNNIMKLREKYATSINVPLNVPIKFIIIVSLLLFFITRKIIFIIIPTIYIIYQLLRY